MCKKKLGIEAVLNYMEGLEYIDNNKDWKFLNKNDLYSTIKKRKCEFA